jgi:cytochrome c oxidase cbb3-type subunit 1
LPEDIDHSCRYPVMFLFTWAIVWLIVSLAFGLLGSIKMHAPGMLASIPALTYGRVVAASSSALLWGFASQAGIGIALWLFARLGRAYLVLPRAGLMAAILWNIAVLLGVCAILAGGMTQFRAYQMPLWTAPIFFVSFVVLGLSGLLTFVSRSERDLYPSMWFLFAAFFVFPWILMAAWLLLGHYTNIRGTLEPIVSIWFANNFTLLWLGSIALAVLFYFISKLSQQPLYSYAMAGFSFWFYLLLANASGFQNAAGLPNWMANLSAVVNVLILLPVGVMVYNWWKTSAGHNRVKKEKDISTKYVNFATFGFVSGILLQTIDSCPVVDEGVGLTVFQLGLADWIHYAFIAMAFFAAIYHIAPRLTEVDWPSVKTVGVHYGLTVAGIVILAGSLMLGGYVQGNAINNPGLPFNDVVRQTLPYIGFSTIGILLLLGAQLALLWNLALLAQAQFSACCGGTREANR